MPIREQANGDQRVVESKTEARQGFELHRIRYVLAFGIAGTVITFAIAAFVVL